ncbi:hypothetical protein COY26_05325 [Candidatus Woesearchaeota archaeon CG_4_10_14_0_2_um_filter_33_10]|nr:MAG: hypothetical protein AUJ83_02595 [Candidatus Woesearchaeota archaeon CG1_02_33_12]PIN78310.1 MAG: hypothetical protein COV14_04070 [Candidatus Woesearchaeota archaeon CG10_big_fil_rev_8_21_14_0_10_33_12]PIU72491.1 MAG: hypothetical protein COS79_02595 [Candidatus Woesearchaeota archaeon CG06_land_8_20_14_3_00_33_13]PIZ51946.1 MAG: hypothetical protein COY26_05325 [Candidatus Woesearchaeota archaeon CG_4_10_14_0_2_um_filter_33_10]
MSAESKRKETLVDFLGLERLKISQGEVIYRDLVKYALMHQYGSQDKTFVNDNVKQKLEFSLFSSDDFNTHFLSAIPKSKRTKKRMKKIIESFKERIQSADLEEVIQASLQITEKIEKNDPTTFYEAAIDVYYRIMREGERFSYSGHFFSTQVKPLLESNKGCLSIKELMRILDRNKFNNALFGLPDQQQIRILNNKYLRTQDVDTLVSELRDRDNKRKELHQKILAYAKKHFQKDYLDVYIDILSEERLPTESYTNLYSPRKGYLVFNVGFLDLRSSGGQEFSRAFGEEDNRSEKEWIERGYETLRQAREEEFSFFGKPEYKSRIKESRSEEEDNQLLDQIQSRFKDYVSFKGDYLYKDMHGHYIFGKIIVFNADKIRDKDKNPTIKVDEIRDYITSLLPPRKSIF